MHILYNWGNYLFCFRDIVIFLQNIGQFAFFEFLLFCLHGELLNVSISSVIFKQEYTRSRIRLPFVQIYGCYAVDHLHRAFYGVTVSAIFTIYPILPIA